MSNAIALGTFDGIHSGHRAVLDAVLPYHSVAVTFPVPPKTIDAETGSLIMTAEDKCRALKAYGIAEIEWLDFAAVRDLSPTGFLDRICEKYRPVRIACGYNYRFGRNAAGTTETLNEYCRCNGIDFFCAERINADGEPISSTRIRQWLAEGEIARANQHIMGGFQFHAAVLHGDARGRTLGFPTANQCYPKELTPIKHGVYISRVEFDRKQYIGITNIGHRPTWPTDAVLCETYLPTFAGNLYDREIAVYPLRFLRAEQRFDSVEKLTAAIRRDVAAAIAEKAELGL